MEKYTRRDFIKTAGVVGTATLLASLGFRVISEENNALAAPALEADLPSGWGERVDDEAERIGWEMVYGKNFKRNMEDIRLGYYDGWKRTDVMAQGGLLGSPDTRVTAGYNKRVIAKITGDVHGVQSLDLGFSVLTLDGVDKKKMMNLYDANGNKVETTIYAPTLLSMLRRFGSDGCEIVLDIKVRTPESSGNTEFPEEMQFDMASKMQIESVNVLFDNNRKGIPQPKLDTMNINDDGLGSPTAFYFVFSDDSWWMSSYIEKKEIKQSGL